MFYSSIVCCIYNHVNVDDVHGTMSAVLDQEVEMYNCSMYILILSTLALGFILITRTKNPN